MSRQIVPPDEWITFNGQRLKVAAVLTNAGERYYMLVSKGETTVSLMPADIVEALYRPTLETKVGCIHRWLVLGAPRDPRPDQICEGGCGQTYAAVMAERAEKQTGRGCANGCNGCEECTDYTQEPT